MVDKIGDLPEQETLQSLTKKRNRDTPAEIENHVRRKKISSPWLMLPSDQESNCQRFYSLQEDKVGTIKNKKLCNARCLGSSQGWLVTLSDEETLHLFNPISGSRRSMKIPADIKSDTITKVILSSDPSRNDNFCVAMIWGLDLHYIEDRLLSISKLAFYNHGIGKWTPELDRHKQYCDIIFNNDQLFALATDNCVSAWDCSHCRESPPVKTIKNLRPRSKDIDHHLKEYSDEYDNLFSTQTYSVESSGDILYVVRCIGNYVNHEGVAIDEFGILDDSNGICPYRTLQFYVWKINFAANKWEKVECLRDRALLLGGSHSLSISARDVSGFQENSIYFTDDRWDEIELVRDDHEEYAYGGHDMGVFNLEKKVVEQFYKLDTWRIDPPPFWLVPNP